MCGRNHTATKAEQELQMKPGRHGETPGQLSNMQEEPCSGEPCSGEPCSGEQPAIQPARERKRERNYEQKERI